MRQQIVEVDFAVRNA